MKRIAIVRGKFLNQYEMQFFEPLADTFDVTAFGSLFPYHESFAFSVVKLPSPMDLPEFPYKMPILNRLFVDAQYLYGLEKKLAGFDLVHTAETYFRYTQQCLDAKKGGVVKKVIATVLENIPHNNEGIRGRVRYKQRALRELDHIIALTQKTKDVLLKEGADEKKITIIPHFIDTKRFFEAKRLGAGTEEQPLTILFAGRLEMYKGVYDVLDAIRLLQHDKALRNIAIRWVFAGDGSERFRMTRIASSYPQPWSVKFVRVPYAKMPGVYAQADIFVAPSKPRFNRGKPTWEEQYCTALLEAQAAGLPIVTTNSGGIAENVKDAALLVPPGNIPKLASALRSFIMSPQKRTAYARKARKRAESVHDIRHGARMLSSLYERVL